MPLSRSELMVLASLSAAFGVTSIWFATTWLPAADLAIDSAFCLSASEGTCPLSVTTPLSRSSLTDTSLRPAWSRDLRTEAETSGDFGVLEQPDISRKSVNKAADNLNAFTVFPSSARLVQARVDRPRPNDSVLNLQVDIRRARSAALDRKST